jgi:D-sedoheptulose 7-phosphate isomerase
MSVKPLIESYLDEVMQIATKIDRQELVNLVTMLHTLTTEEARGRLFVVGVGGSAGNASHAVNDFRKIAGIESYCPTDNVSELTARINDDGWDSSISNWLRVSRANARDVLLVLSVGGGSPSTSVNLTSAMNHMRSVQGRVCAIVSRDGGYARKLADVCVMVPVVNEGRITPHAEEWQAVVWHMVTDVLRTWGKSGE